MGKSCLLIVQGLHGSGEKITEDWPGVFNFRLGVPSLDLEGELGKEFHMMNTGENHGVAVKRILGVFEFGQGLILPTKVLIDSSASVKGRNKVAWILTTSVRQRMVK